MTNTPTTTMNTLLHKRTRPWTLKSATTASDQPNGTRSHLRAEPSRTRIPDEKRTGCFDGLRRDLRWKDGFRCRNGFRWEDRFCWRESGVCGKGWVERGTAHFWHLCSIHDRTRRLRFVLDWFGKWLQRYDSWFPLFYILLRILQAHAVRHFDVFLVLSVHRLVSTTLCEGASIPLQKGYVSSYNTETLLLQVEDGVVTTK